MKNTEATYTVKQTAARFGVGACNVLKWIRSGELGAVNVTVAGIGRPRWRIRACDLLAFELKRFSRHTSPPTISRIRRAPAGDVPRRF